MSSDSTEIMASDLMIEELEFYLRDLNFPEHRIEAIKEEARGYNIGGKIEPVVVTAQGHPSRVFRTPLCYISRDSVKKDEVLRPFTTYYEGKYEVGQYYITQNHVTRFVVYSFEGRYEIRKKIKVVEGRIVLEDV